MKDSSMGKNRDVMQILVIILIGMFIPYFLSLALIYGINYLKIAQTFGLFLFIFGVELGLVYLYFSLSAKRSQKQMKKLKPKENGKE